MSNKKIKKKTKLKLGKKTDEGYEYSAKVDFKEDFSKQIAGLIQEKKASDELEIEIKRLKEIVKKFTDEEKDKTLNYYYTVGNNLLFLDKKIFKDISIFSILRRITEELPEILPYIEKERKPDHLMAMYRLGQIDKKVLRRASWGQWYEITKFKDIYKKPKILEQILEECKSGITGPSLRAKIKNLLS